jgi:hypothetical protein
VVAYGITAGTAYEGMNGAAASNLAYSASTNAEAARQIGTNAQELAVVVSNQLYQGPLISGNNDIIIGSGASGDGIHTVAIGDDAYAYTGVAIGSQAKAYYRYATAIGWGAVATNYGVAVGKGSYATNSSVALGADVENTVAGTTRIKGDLEMAGEDVLGVGTLTTTNLAIVGGATNGGVWVCTDSATGAGEWTRSITNISSIETEELEIINPTKYIYEGITQTTNILDITISGIGFQAKSVRAYCTTIGSQGAYDAMWSITDSIMTTTTNSAGIYRIKDGRMNNSVDMGYIQDPAIGYWTLNIKSVDTNGVVLSQTISTAPGTNNIDYLLIFNKY